MLIMLPTVSRGDVQKYFGLTEVVLVVSVLQQKKPFSIVHSCLKDWTPMCKVAFWHTTATTASDTSW